MMEDFCKLFRSERHGQILVVEDRDQEEGVPSLTFSCTPPGLGVCSISLKWEDDDDGWDRADYAFSTVNQEFAEEMADKVFRDSAPFAPKEDDDGS